MNWRRLICQQCSTLFTMPRGTTMLMVALTKKGTQLGGVVRAAALVSLLFNPCKFDLQSEIFKDLVETVCALPDIDCTALLPNIVGPNCCINPEKVPLYIRYYPQATSSRNIAHYAQGIRKGTFSMFDYGPPLNRVHYGQENAPIYDLSNFPSSVHLLVISGTRDALSNPTDVALLTASLQQSIKDSIIVTNYAHVDFMLSETADVDVWAYMSAWFQALTSS